ncbi:TPA: hypothetical protein NI618_001646 [Pseudomonas aeruginosa]|jgi:hypothetical protein|uniref:hypothetical protein n=1 Tax=Pseudomonas aeruginosa TaxID=287 RepID=UPI000BB7CC92|nr:hypothetical protein [Pseudomonas aeruginosa]MCV4061399.1 hypothetical protein [Pseudomonas aeruginosa]MCV4079375.1 hypothetical protein [Pseudomonas aeruginosa]MCV4148813.1 hypothetical protein [Pseudomonas aeruginosa]MCV4180384.1 hypothetical protein [Pseudomonas aeruginosa]MCV4219847.1 hypothetical protein [Pseudomonas aeruginosa]
MSKPTKYGPPVKLFNILGASELRQSRIMVVLLFIILAAAAIVGFLIFQVVDLQRANAQLSADRVMYGYPNAEGVFVSEKVIPRRHVEGFVSWYIQNYYNFTPESAEGNATEALRIMSPSLRVKQEQPLKTLARQSIEQEITQVFAPDSGYTIEYKPGKGYIVSFKGTRIRATMNRVFSQRQYDVKLLLKPVKPSAHFEWALVVDDYIAQEI